MIHAQDAHVCAAARAALFDGLGRCVKHLHEADRAGSYAARGAHRRAGCAQTRKREPSPAAALMDERRILYRLKDFRHGIRYRQHEARGKLSERLARIHKRGRIRHEQKLRHDFIELVRKCRNIRIGSIRLVPGGNRIRNAAEHAFRCFDQLRCFVSGQIPAFQHSNGVFAQACHSSVPLNALYI